MRFETKTMLSTKQLDPKDSFDLANGILKDEEMSVLVEMYDDEGQIDGDDSRKSALKALIKYGCIDETVDFDNHYNLTEFGWDVAMFAAT